MLRAAALALLLRACGRATAQEAAVPTIPPLTEFDRWKYQPPDQLLPLTYRAQGMALLAERRERIDALAGAAQWRARQADVSPPAAPLTPRRRLCLLAGPRPPLAPLHPGSPAACAGAGDSA